MYNFFIITTIVLFTFQIMSLMSILDAICKKDIKYLLIPLSILTLILLNIITINYHINNRSPYYFGQTNIVIKNGIAKYQNIDGDWVNANCFFKRNFKENDIIYHYKFDPNPLNEPVLTTYKTIQELKNGKRN